MPNNIQDSPKNNDHPYTETVDVPGYVHPLEGINTYGSESTKVDAIEARRAAAYATQTTIRQAKETATKALWAVNRTNPIAQSHVPTQGATGVAVGANITVTFSVKMDPATLNATNVLVTRGGTPVAATLSYDATTKVLTINPDANLQAATLHTVTLKAGSFNTWRGIHSVNGEPLQADKVFTFTTA